MFALNIEVSDVHAILSSEMTKIKMADTLSSSFGILTIRQVSTPYTRTN